VIIGSIVVRKIETPVAGMWERFGPPNPKALTGGRSNLLLCF
jgi:hypothetical protein